MNKTIFTVPEAIQYQQATYGCVPYRRDALYAVIRSAAVRVIRVGRRRVYIPQASLDSLLTGTTTPFGRQ